MLYIASAELRHIIRRRWPRDEREGINVTVSKSRLRRWFTRDDRRVIMFRVAIKLR